MKNTLKLVLFVVGLSALASLNSCTKQVNLKPKYGFNSEAVYKDPKNYINVLAKLYAGLATTGNEGPAGSPDIASTDEGFSQYVRALYNLQVLPTDEAVCGWPDVGIPDLCKSTWSAENTFVKMMYNRIFFQIALSPLPYFKSFISFSNSTNSIRAVCEETPNKDSTPFKVSNPS